MSTVKKFVAAVLIFFILFVLSIMIDISKGFLPKPDYSDVINYAKSLNGSEMGCGFTPPNTVRVVYSDAWYNMRPFEKERFLMDMRDNFTNQLMAKKLDTYGLRVIVYDIREREIAHATNGSIDIGKD